MKIDQFINKFQNHPILFVGTGISLRYLENSYSWENLLKNISEKISGNSFHFQDLKSKAYSKSKKTYDYAYIASILEEELDKISEFVQGMQKPEYIDEINAVYYSSMNKGMYASRLKILISNMLSKLHYRNSMQDEIDQIKKIRKNIACIITTNYDNLIEDIFRFNPLVGNDIILSNPYGSVYKIHGSVENHNSIVITNEDYKEFNTKYDLIRAQLISLFIHNPIIFLGYSISDDNIKQILKTIFSYVDYTDNLSDKIRSNFLLVEHKEGSNNSEVIEHDVNIDNTVIRINKIITDDYSLLYKALSNLRLPISAMEVRKVRDIVGDIYKGGKPEDIPAVRITEDIDDLDNRDKVLAIGTEKTISYEFRTIKEMVVDYFSILEENNFQILDTIDKQTINSSQYFPIFAFEKINRNIKKANKLKKYQISKINQIKERMHQSCKEEYTKIEDILQNNISPSKQEYCIIWNVLEEKITLDDFKEFIQSYVKIRDLTRQKLLNSSDYKRLVCVYDYCKFGRSQNIDC